MMPGREPKPKPKTDDTAPFEMDDLVHSPSHYRQGSMEVYDAITGMGLSYTEGAIVKYVARWKYKNGLQDLEKARWYLDRLIQEQRNAQK